MPKSKDHYRLSRTGDVICHLAFGATSQELQLTPLITIKDKLPMKKVASFTIKTHNTELASVAFDVSKYCFKFPYKNDIQIVASGKSEMNIHLVLESKPISSKGSLLPPLPSALGEATHLIYHLPSFPDPLLGSQYPYSRNP